jgi:ATP-dependent RNA helicase DeaD
MPSKSTSVRRRQDSRKQSFKAICTKCNESTFVPFKPSPDRAVYCTDCFKEQQSSAKKQSSNLTFKTRNPDEGHKKDRTSNYESSRVDKLDSQENIENSIPLSEEFESMEISPSLKKAISSMNISVPTPIQKQSIPALLQGRDIIGQARTGSGKTLAFAVPMVTQCDPLLNKVQGMVLVPTRELAIQVASVIKSLAAPENISVSLLYGGHSMNPERSALRRGTHIIVGTPGRTLDHLRQKNLNLNFVKFFVLDEADEMLDKGFLKDIETVLTKTPRTRQTALFSATMPNWVTDASTRHLNNPLIVKVDAELDSAPSIEHTIYTIQANEKVNALQTLLNQSSKDPSIVFGKTKHGVKKLAKTLKSLGYPVEALQGNLSQRAREQVMTNFRSGKTPILIATNVAARGLDFNGIGQVINFDLPDTQQNFTHRVGRTGRMGQSGQAITFITPGDERKWREIQRHLGTKFKKEPWLNKGAKDLEE